MSFTGRIYLGRGEDGREQYEWIGRFDSKAERDKAVLRRRLEREAELTQAKLPPSERITCSAYATDILARMESGGLGYKRHGEKFRYKASSLDTMRQALKPFLLMFGDRTLASITRDEAERWAETMPNGVVAVVVTLFRAVKSDLLDRNPFHDLSERTKGRADQAPPTEEQMILLLDACSALGDHAPQMRALLKFASYTGMRPGELFALEWSDIDFDANRVQVCRRVYKQTLDLPKSNKARTIALTPPAKDALLELGMLEGGLVFRSKQGRRLSQPTLSQYWAQVRARAGFDHDFYLASKHFAVHHMYVRLGLPVHVIAAQMGWSRASVEKLIDTYAHAEIGALEAIDRAFSDANQMQTAAIPAP